MSSTWWKKDLLGRLNRVERCVYLHKINEEVIYVGSGTLDRAFSTFGRSKEHSLLMNDDSFSVKIVKENLTREESYKLEYELGYYYLSLGQAKFFNHDMRGKNNPMNGVSLYDVLSEEKVIQWKTNLSKSLKSKNNGFRSECVVIAPFEKVEKKKFFHTIREAADYIHEKYGPSAILVKKNMINKPYSGGVKFKHLKGLEVRVLKEYGSRRETWANY